MRLKRPLFGPCPFDKVLKVGRLSPTFQKSPSEGVEGPNTPIIWDGRGYEMTHPSVI